MSALEHELQNKIAHLTEDQQREVLSFVDQLLPPSMASRPMTAREMMKLPPDERERLVRESFALAADEEFEIFEAYSEEGLDDPT